MTIFKYTGFSSTEKLVKTMVGTICFDDYLCSFSVTNLANKSIVLSGGQEYSDENFSAKTFLIDVEKGIIGR